MNHTHPQKTPAPSVVGTVFSSLGAAGLVGIFVLFVTLLTEPGGGGINNPADLITFGVRAIVLVFGGGLCAIFSLVGMILGLTQLKSPIHPLTWTSVVLGILGLLSAAALLAWRMNVVFN